MRSLVAWIVFTGQAVSIASMLLSIARPDRRTWPLPATHPWPPWTRAALGALGMIGIFGQLPLGILDWNGFLWSHGSRFVPGGLLLAWGGFFGLWGYTTLGPHASQGHESDLVVAGAYRHCRNPQYVGAIASFTGYAILCNSGLGLIAAGLSTVLFILMPFAEEPWLRERLGPAYEHYAARVPRFLPALRPAGADRGAAGAS